MRGRCTGLTSLAMLGGERGRIGRRSIRSSSARKPNPAIQPPPAISRTSSTRAARRRIPRASCTRHAYTFAKRMQAAFWLDAQAGDLVWCTAGTGWAKSLWNVLLGPWSCGSAIVCTKARSIPEAHGSDPRSRVTVLCQAPTEYRLEAKLERLGERWKLPNLRHCVSRRRAAQSRSARAVARGVRPDDSRRLRTNRKFAARRQLAGNGRAPGSMGKPTPGHDVAVSMPKGECASPATSATSRVRGATADLFRGYYKNDEETTASRAAARGTSPATARNSTTTATSGSSGAPTTSSRRAVSHRAVRGGERAARTSGGR